MARIVKMVHNGPTPITVGNETIHICRCGLSGTMPHCDGNHVLCSREAPNKLYWYDSDGVRREIDAESYPGLRGDNHF